MLGILQSVVGLPNVEANVCFQNDTRRNCFLEDGDGGVEVEAGFTGGPWGLLSLVTRLARSHDSTRDDKQTKRLTAEKTPASQKTPWASPLTSFQRWAEHRVCNYERGVDRPCGRHTPSHSELILGMKATGGLKGLIGRSSVLSEGDARKNRRHLAVSTVQLNGKSAT